MSTVHPAATAFMASSAASAAGRQMPASRALAALLLGFIAGVGWQLQQRSLDVPAAIGAETVYGIGALACALMLALLWASLLNTHVSSRMRRRFAVPSPWVAVFFAATLSAGLGFSLTALRAAHFQKTAIAGELEGKDITVTGWVQAMPQTGEDGVRFRFLVESAQLKEGGAAKLPPLIYLGWYAGFGFGARANAPRPPSAVNRAGTQAKIDDVEPSDFLPELQRQPQDLRAGERWQMTVRLKAPHGNSNPHGFDYELWLWEQGLQATGYVRAGPRDAPPKRLGEGWSHPVERARHAVRDAIYARIENRQLAGVLAALVTGDQNAIERADWDVFRATGVAHLMSISGLHITMFAWLASRLIGALWRRSVRLTPAFCLAVPASSAAAWGGLILAALYALFSGWGVPAQRTIWMLATMVVLRQSGRQWPWPFVWLLAMFVVVVLDPWALMQAGFWLSFVAVGVLFATDSGAVSVGNTGAAARFDSQDGLVGHFFAIRLFQPLIKAVRGLGTAAREQWVVTLALTPLSLLLFNQVSLVGLLANAVAIPWVTLVVTPLAMMGALWSPIWDMAALSVKLLAAFLQWLASWPLASISRPAAPLWFAVAGVLGGGIIAMRLPWSWRLLGLPLLLPVLLWQPARPAPGQFEIIGADIGQGNALIVRTASHSMVYDTGPRFSRESDAGNRVLVPLLRAMDEQVDLLMLSHRDLDHIGGAQAVLAMQPQARLVSSIEADHELQAIRASTRCLAGQTWRWDGVDFEVLHPVAADYDTAAKSNAMSCILRISNNAQTALLAGDLEAPQEARLVNNPAMADKLKADFLLVPHHGSKTSSSPAFLDQVHPRFALAQAGYRNHFNHPAALVMARYRERGIPVFKSPECGAATWRSAQPERVTCNRQEARRYWHHQTGDAADRP